MNQKKILEKIEDVSERKNTFVEYIEKCFKEILEELEKKNPEFAKQKKKDFEKDLINIDNMIKKENINEDEDEDEDKSKLNNSLKYPIILDDFVKSQLHYLLD